MPPLTETRTITLDHFEQKWGSKYYHAVQNWHRNWNDLIVFFDFPVEIRIIYIRST